MATLVPLVYNNTNYQYLETLCSSPIADLGLLLECADLIGVMDLESVKLGRNRSWKWASLFKANTEVVFTSSLHGPQVLQTDLVWPQRKIRVDIRETWSLNFLNPHRSPHSKSQVPLLSNQYPKFHMSDLMSLWFHYYSMGHPIKFEVFPEVVRNKWWFGVFPRSTLVLWL